MKAGALKNLQDLLGIFGANILLAIEYPSLGGVRSIYLCLFCSLHLPLSPFTVCTACGNAGGAGGAGGGGGC